MKFRVYAYIKSDNQYIETRLVQWVRLVNYAENDRIGLDFSDKCKLVDSVIITGKDQMIMLN